MFILQITTLEQKELTFALLFSHVKPSSDLRGGGVIYLVFLHRINSIKINWYRCYIVSAKKTSLTYLIKIACYTTNTCGLSILWLSVIFQILNIAYGTY